MSSFEWLELQTLTSDIAASRSRLAAARSAKDHRQTRMLEQEIRTAEDRRNRLLANITNHVATAAEPAPQSAAEEPRDAAPLPVIELMDEALRAEARAAAQSRAEKSLGEESESDKPTRKPGPVVANGVAPPEPAAAAWRTEGGKVVWDQLTPGDIERAKNDLGVRRAEMLARHAEELKSLDADMSQLDGLEQAIAAFARKFKAPAEGSENGAVVALEEERELRVGRS